MNSITVPDTGQQLTDGTIVMLARYPGTKWIVHKGWYSFQGHQYNGWYFCSIPAQTILPVGEEDLRLLTVISDTECECCPPIYPPNPCPPNPECPPHPHPVPFTPRMAYELDRAWISVDTIAQMNQLNKRLLPNGKIVRVNDDSSGAKYFRWNQVTQVWELETFGIDLTSYVKADNLENSVNKLLTESTVINDSITNIVDDATKDAFSKIKNRLLKLEEAAEWIEL